MIETNTGWIFHNSGGSWNAINYGERPIGSQGQVWTASGSGAYWANPVGTASIAMNDLTDVTITSVKRYEHLEYNGTDFVNVPSNIIGHKQGMWYGLTSSPTYGIGLLAEGLVISGDVFARVDSTSGQGFGLQITNSGTSANGLSQNNPYYAMGNNSSMMVSFTSTTLASNTRIYIGFSASGTGLTGEDPLNAQPGVLVGFRIADNSDTMKVFYNDTAGSTNVVDTNVSYNEQPFTAEIILSSGTANIYVSGSLTTSVTDTSNLPTPTTKLFAHWEIQRAGGSEKTLELYRILTTTD